MANEIATLADVYSITGKSYGTYTSNRCATKTLAVNMGARASSLSTYSNNQLVPKDKIVKDQFTINGIVLRHASNWYNALVSITIDGVALYSNLDLYYASPTGNPMYILDYSNALIKSITLSGDTSHRVVITFSGMNTMSYAYIHLLGYPIIRSLTSTTGSIVTYNGLSLGYPARTGLYEYSTTSGTYTTHNISFAIDSAYIQNLANKTVTFGFFSGPYQWLHGL